MNLFETYKRIITENATNEQILNQYLKLKDIDINPMYFTTLHKPINGRGLYKLGDNILKITESKLEYENAKKLVEKPLNGFIKYYDAQQIGSRYVLVMEEIEPINDKQNDIVEFINNSLGVSDYMLDKYRVLNFKQRLRRHPDDYEYLNTDEDAILWYLNQLQNMYMQAEKNGLTLYDLRGQNLGWNNDYQLVHFDLGGD